MNSNDLENQARDFANRMTRILQSVLVGAPGFQVEAVANKAGDGRLNVKPPGEIKLLINQQHTLDLAVRFSCVWDHRKQFLKVEDAHFHVKSVWTGDPLFRYEYRSSSTRAPVAHLQLHAHRDELLYSLIRAEKGRPKGRSRDLMEGGKPPPRLADVHFPLGGPRMRPALEDVLQLLMDEFSIDVAPGARTALKQGRKQWRREQIAASVRDSPEVAARSLRELGYEVTWLKQGNGPAERKEKLTQY